MAFIHLAHQAGKKSSPCHASGPKRRSSFQSRADRSGAGISINVLSMSHWASHRDHSLRQPHRHPSVHEPRYAAAKRRAPLQPSADRQETNARPMHADRLGMRDNRLGALPIRKLSQS